MRRDRFTRMILLLTNEDTNIYLSLLQLSGIQCYVEPFDNGFPNPLTTFVHGMYVFWECDDRYELTSADNMSYCIAGSWNGTSPVCTGKDFGTKS